MGQTSGLVRSVIPERHIPPFNKVQILDGVTGQAATLPVSPKIVLTSDFRFGHHGIRYAITAQIDLSGRFFDEDPTMR